MITHSEAYMILKNYCLVKNKVPYQHKIDEALSPLKDNEFEIAQLILYKVPRRRIIEDEKITEYQYYKIRNKALLCLRLNLNKEDFENVISKI